MRLFMSCSVAALVSCAPPVWAETHVTVNRGTVVQTVESVAAARARMSAIPGGAAVVDSRSFENKYVLDFKDMLGLTPGIFAQPRYGEESRLSMRGSGLSRSFHLRGITLLQDGVSFNLADGGGDFQEIDPLLLQHVEVYRGANALQYGSTTLGGAINLVTPSARLVPYSYYLRAEGGSFNTLRLHAATAQKNDRADAYIATTKTVAEGYRRQSEQNKDRVYANAGLKLSDAAETRFYLFYNNLEQEVPSALSRADALDRPKSVAPVNILNDYARDIRSLRIANKTTLRLDAATLLDLGGFMNRKDLYHPIFQVIDQDSLDLGLYARLEGKADAAFGRNDYTLGMNLSRGTVDALRFVNVGGNRGALTAESDQTAENMSIYGENRWFLRPDFAVVTGLQGFYARRESEDRLNPAASDERTYTGLNPKLGLLWNALPTASLYANASRSSEVPTFSELVQMPVTGFVPLDTQDAWTYEIGSRGEYGDWSWDVSAYHARLRHELLAFTVDPSTPASIFNAGKTIHQGLEIGGAYRISPSLSASLAYTYSDFFFDGDTQYGDNDLPGAPRHLLHAQLDYTALPGLTVSPNLQWAPDGGYVDYANTLDAPGYLTIGAKADYRITPALTLFLDARNLTDERIITNYNAITNAATAPTSVFYPGEGRSLYAGFSVKF